VTQGGRGGSKSPDKCDILFEWPLGFVRDNYELVSFVFIDQSLITNHTAPFVFNLQASAVRVILFE